MRITPWPGEPSLALVTTASRPISIETSTIKTIYHHIRGLGFEGLLWQATTHYAELVLEQLGFTLRDRLTVLQKTGDLREGVLPPPLTPGLQVRRARSGDLEEVLAIDRICFGTFWQLDAHGISDALLATPHARYRIIEDTAVEHGGRIVAYCIMGHGARNGFLQRIAVNPQRQGLGLARALIYDGLRWLHHWRCHTVTVNTQVTNARALALYQNLHFRVLERGIALYESPSSL